MSEPPRGKGGTSCLGQSWGRGGELVIPTSTSIAHSTSIPFRLISTFYSPNPNGSNHAEGEREGSQDRRPPTSRIPGKRSTPLHSLRLGGGKEPTQGPIGPG